MHMRKCYKLVRIYILFLESFRFPTWFLERPHAILKQVNGREICNERSKIA